MALLDQDIREPLLLFMEERQGRVRFIEEKTMGRSRADILMVTDEALCGIEIKSDADSYQRLASQVKDYNRVCEKNWVVVGSTHAGHIEEHVPAFWGIITVEEMKRNGKRVVDFYVLREPAPNPRWHPLPMVSLLWRPELNQLLEKNQLPRYQEKSRAFVAGKLVEKVPLEVLRGQVLEALFERDYNTIEETIEDYKREQLLKKAGGGRR